MKWQAGVSAAVVAAVIVVASATSKDDEEARAQDAFALSVRAGDEAYGRICGNCHGRYDPRFHVYGEWRRLLDGPGCPKEQLYLTQGERDAIRNFLRAKAAPTEDEAETVSGRERSRVLAERSGRGAEVYAKTCARCHEHPYYVKTRTAEEWTEVLRELGALHRDAGESVRVDKNDGADLACFLNAVAAGTASDASDIRTLIASGSASVEGPAEVVPTEVHWVRDYDQGVKEAFEKKKPVIVDLTDLSGG